MVIFFGVNYRLWKGQDAGIKKGAFECVIHLKGQFQSSWQKFLDANTAVRLIVYKIYDKTTRKRHTFGHFKKRIKITLFLFCLLMRIYHTHTNLVTHLTSASLIACVVECWLWVRIVPGSIPNKGPCHTKDVKKWDKKFHFMEDWLMSNKLPRYKTSKHHAEHIFSCFPAVFFRNQYVKEYYGRLCSFCCWYVKI